MEQPQIPVSIMKRRSFFGAAAKALGAVLGWGSLLLKREPEPPVDPPVASGKITVRINDLAVPRTTNASEQHG